VQLGEREQLVTSRLFFATPIATCGLIIIIIIIIHQIVVTTTHLFATDMLCSNDDAAFDWNFNNTSGS
jgi:hypothetical protein